MAACGDEALAVNSAGAGPVSAEWMVPKVRGREDWWRRLMLHVPSSSPPLPPCVAATSATVHLTGLLVLASTGWRSVALFLPLPPGAVAEGERAGGV